MSVSVSICVHLRLHRVWLRPPGPRYVRFVPSWLQTDCPDFAKLKVIDRHVLKELVKYALIAVGSVVAIYLLIDLFEELS